jgi:hypothetical protein
MHPTVNNVVFVGMREPLKGADCNAQCNVLGQLAFGTIQKGAELQRLRDRGSDDDQTAILAATYCLRRDQVRMHKIRKLGAVPGQRAREAFAFCEATVNDNDAGFLAGLILRPKHLTEEPDRQALLARIACE